MPQETGNSVRYDPADAGTLKADLEFAALYEASFPEHEREPLEVIWRTVAEGRGVVIRARAGERTVGFITLHLVAQPSIAFVVYLAVATSRRREGIGSALLKHGWREASARTQHAGRTLAAYVWEIDPPIAMTDYAEEARRRGRLDFFCASGGSVLCESYFQPPVHGPAPVPMWLMIRGTPGQPLPSAPAVIAGIYSEKYAAMNGIDRAILEQLLGRVTTKVGR